MIASVEDIMTKELVIIDCYDGLCKAERLMKEHHIGCLPVLKQGILAGILTSKDIRESHPNRIVADAMSKKIISVSPDTSLWKAKQVMEANHIERLLVVEEGELLGLLTQVQLFLEIGKYTDLLTGLYKSDYVYHHSIELMTHEAEISLIFIDINKFGLMNKSYGHIQGDMILKELSTLLRNHIPADTYLCRFGGDEFLVLTPYRMDQCKVLAENIIKEISSHTFSNGLAISASAGISGYKKNAAKVYNPMHTVTHMVNLASLASTQAKKEPNGLVISSELCDCEEIA